MNLKLAIRKVKRKIAVWFFKDVMDSNSKKYLEFINAPEEGVKELSYLNKNRLIDKLEEKLDSGITDRTLFDDLFAFYMKTNSNEFNSIHLEVSNQFLEMLTEHELTTGVVLDKEPLYFFKAVLEITLSNTIGAMAYWELASKEKSRISGDDLSIADLIEKLPEATIQNVINDSYVNNLFIIRVRFNYPILFGSNFKTVANKLSIVDAISFLSCGLKNVQAINLIKAYGNSLHLNRIFAQEIINSLCVVCESTIKDYPEISIALPRKKDRQIGKMLAPYCLEKINPALSVILGSSNSGYSGMYATLSGIMSDTTFNTQFPTYISDLGLTTYPEVEFKARVLVGIHSLRNKVLHDIDDTLCYFYDAELFIKTIGLLFAGVVVTQNLR